MYFIHYLLLCQFTGVICSKELPGLSYLKSGFDAHKMISVDEFSSGDRVKFHIFDLSENDGDVFPLTIANEKQYFTVPYLASVTHLSMLTYVAVESISKSYSNFIAQYYSSYSFGLSVIIPIKYVLLTLGVEVENTVRYAYQLMRSNYTAVATSSAWLGMYSIQLAPSYLLKFSPVFNKSISKLKSNPNTEHDQFYYNSIVTTFGTHYVSSVIVGGVATLYTFLSEEWQRTSSYYSTQSSISIGANLGFEIPLKGGLSIGLGLNLGGVSFGGSWGASGSSESESFKRNSIKKFLFRPPIHNSTAFKGESSLEAWLYQTSRQPVVVNRTLYPLSDLLIEYPDGIADHLRLTIDYYLEHGSLPKLNDLLRGRAHVTGMGIPIPGIDTVGCGYDIFRLQSKKCLFNFSYDNNTVWKKLFNDHQSYRIPDGLKIIGTSELYSTYDTQIFDDYNKYIKNFIYSNIQDSEGFLGFGTFTRQKEIVTRLRRFSDYYFNLAWTKRKVVWYNLSVAISMPTLNRDFQMALNQLPTLFDEKNFTFVWKNFFDNYGTHYVASAEFGGIISAEDYFDSCIIQNYSSSWIKEQIKYSYDYFSTSEYNSLVKVVPSETFLNHRVSNVQIIGGDANLNSFQMKSWMETIRKQPRPISYKLLPIYTLLPFYSKERKALQDATFYIRLNELNETMKYIQSLESMTHTLPISAKSCF